MQGVSNNMRAREYPIRTYKVMIYNNIILTGTYTPLQYINMDTKAITLKAKVRYTTNLIRVKDWLEVSQALESYGLEYRLIGVRK